jgi:hypothetical protein
MGRVGVPESVPRVSAEPSHVAQLSATKPRANLGSLLCFPLIQQGIVKEGILVDLVFVNRRSVVRFHSPAPVYSTTSSPLFSSTFTRVPGQIRNPPFTWFLAALHITYSMKSQNGAEPIKADGSHQLSEPRFFVGYTRILSATHGSSAVPSSSMTWYLY